MRFSVTAGVVRTAGTGSVGSSSVDVFTDSNGVANVEIASTSAGPVTVAVEFSSPDLRGGTVSPVSALTDSEGRAAVTFTAGSLPTETDGISISGFLIDHPTVAPAQTQLTVTERQLNVVLCR